MWRSGYALTAQSDEMLTSVTSYIYYSDSILIPVLLIPAKDLTKYAKKDHF